MEELIRGLTIFVPLLGGIGLVFTCAQAIIRNPSMSNSHAIVLGVGALLCVAPTLASFTFKGGGVELALQQQQQQIEKQGAQLKDDLGEQGARLKRDVAELKRRVDALQQQQRTTMVAAGPSAAPIPAAAPAPPAANREGVVLIFYSQTRKDLALKMEDYLLRKGYSANAVFTDFSEISAANRGADGSASIMYTAAKQTLADEIKKELRTRFADANSFTDQVATKLSASDVQIRLF
jgi:hypothetical protein